MILLVSLCIVCLPTREFKLCECSSAGFHPQGLSPCMAHHRWAINIFWMNEFPIICRCWRAHDQLTFWKGRGYGNMDPQLKIRLGKPSMFLPSQGRQAVSVAQEFNTLLTEHNISVLFCFSWIDSCNIWAHTEESYVILGKCITQMFGFCVFQFEYASPSMGVIGLELTALTRKLTLLPDDSVHIGIPISKCFP